MKFIYPIISILSCFTFTPSIFAQQPELEWVKQIGSNFYVIMRDIVTDLDGNTYSIGEFEGTVDFDPDMVGSTEFISEGTQDFFVQKRDPNGNLLWAVQAGGAGFDFVTDLAIDNGGNVYVAGHFAATVDFDPGPETFNLTTEGETNNLANGFIWKLNSSGNLVWVKQLSSAYSLSVSCMDVDNAGNIYASGYFYVEADFDPGPGSHLLTPVSSTGLSDRYILKLDSNGDFMWVKQLGNDAAFSVNSLVTYENGDIVVAGSFIETLDIDPGSGTENITSNGDEDMFIEKLDSDGNFLWGKQLGGPSQDQPTAVLINSLGDVLLAGRFKENIDLDPSPFATVDVTSNGESDIFINSFNSNGDLQWSTFGGGPENEVIRGLDTDDAGNIFVAGSTDGANEWLGLGPSPLMTSMGERDIFATKLSANSTHLWTRTFGSSGDDFCSALSLDDSGSIHLVGGFRDTLNFDPGGTAESELIPMGISTQGYALKLQDSPITLTAEHLPQTLSVFPNPSQGDLFIDFGTTKNRIEIELIDAVGRTIDYSVYSQENLVRLNLPGSDSIYFLRIAADGLVYTTRIFMN